MVVVVVVAYSILVSAQGPLVLGFWFFGFGAKGLGPGLDNSGKMWLLRSNKARAQTNVSSYLDKADAPILDMVLAALPLHSAIR